MENESNEKYEISNLGDVILKLGIGISFLFISYEISRYLTSVCLSNTPAPPPSIFIILGIVFIATIVLGFALILIATTSLEFRRKKGVA